MDGSAARPRLEHIGTFAGRKVVFITVSSSHSCTCPFRSRTLDMPAPTSAVLQIPSVSATSSLWRSCRAVKRLTMTTTKLPAPATVTSQGHSSHITDGDTDFLVKAQADARHAVSNGEHIFEVRKQEHWRPRGHLPPAGHGEPRVRAASSSCGPCTVPCTVEGVLEGSWEELHSNGGDLGLPCTVRARSVLQTARAEPHPLSRPHHGSIEGCSLGTF